MSNTDERYLALCRTWGQFARDNNGDFSEVPLAELNSSVKSMFLSADQNRQLRTWLNQSRDVRTARLTLHEGCRMTVTALAAVPFALDSDYAAEVIIEFEPMKSFQFAVIPRPNAALTYAMRAVSWVAERTMPSVTDQVKGEFDKQRLSINSSNAIEEVISGVEEIDKNFIILTSAEAREFVDRGLFRPLLALKPFSSISVIGSVDEMIGESDVNHVCVYGYRVNAQSANGLIKLREVMGEIFEHMMQHGMVRPCN